MTLSNISRLYSQVNLPPGKETGCPQPNAHNETQSQSFCVWFLCRNRYGMVGTERDSEEEIKR